MDINSTTPIDVTIDVTIMKQRSINAIVVI